MGLLSSQIYVQRQQNKWGNFRNDLQGQRTCRWTFKKLIVIESRCKICHHNGGKISLNGGQQKWADTTDHGSLLCMSGILMNTLKTAHIFIENMFIMDFKSEPPHGKTNNLHRAKTEAQISFAVTAKLISAFVFATRIVQFLFYLNPKFQASSHLLQLYSPVCAGPGRNPNCWFSHAQAQISSLLSVACKG